MTIQCCHDDYSIWFDVSPQNRYVNHTVAHLIVHPVKCLYSDSQTHKNNDNYSLNKENH